MTFAATTRMGGAVRENSAALQRAPLVLIGLLGLFFVLRPYEGITGDAFLYVSRALADLDPQGVGRDWMFQNDRQMQYSAFPVVVRALVRHLGPSLASQTLAGLALLLWFSAFATLIDALERVEQKWLLIAFAVFARSQYSPYFIFTAESLAVPRPFAEAAVLLAMAFLLKGRTRAAAASLAGAALLNPIMALPGFAVLFIVKGLEDRRWIVLAGAGAAAIVAAAALKLPVADRLWMQMDADWRQALDQDLFLSHWDMDTIGAIVVSLCTLALGGWRLEGQARKLLLATVAAGVVGLAASEIAGDQLANLLALQAQPWRAAWLACALAPAGMAVLALDARGRAPAFWLAPSLMALAWAPIGGPAKIAAALTALMLFVVVELGGGAPSPRFCRAAVAATLAAGLIATVAANSDARTMFDETSDLFHWFRNVVLPLNDHVWLFGAAASLLAFRRVSANAPVRLAFAVLSLCLAAVSWDDRSEFRAMTDRGAHIPAFAEALAEKPGEVFWSKATDEPWYLLGRPSWLATIQQWPLLFSREQAMIWTTRNARLLALGVKQKTMLEPQPMLTAAQWRDFCSHNDAPAWIVWPLRDAEAPPSELAPRAIWRAPDHSAAVLRDGRLSRERIDRFMLLPCAGNASQRDGARAH